MAVREDEVRRLGRPADSDSAETRLRVLNEARILFAQDGLSNTTNKALADAAGLTPTAIYHYFSSKSDLYLEVCRDVIDRVSAMFAAASNADETLIGRIDALFIEVSRVSEDDPSVSAFIMGMSDEARRHPEIRDDVVSLQSSLTLALRHMIESSTDQDTLLAGSSVAAFADMLLAALGGFARLRVNTHGAARPRAAAEVLLQLMHRAAQSKTRRTPAPGANSQ